MLWNLLSALTGHPPAVGTILIMLGRALAELFGFGEDS